MTDEQSERRATILNAARAEFARKGFKGATIKSIAQRAGLQSPTLIYWYFPTKEDLFQAVVQEHAPILQAAIDPAPILDLPPAQVLPMLAQRYFATVLQPENQAMARLMIAEAFRRPELADTISERLIKQLLEFLKTYLAHQVELGRLRPHDVRSSARAFIGMLIPQALGLVVFHVLEADGLSVDEHIATAVDLFLHGLQPTREEP